MFGKEAALLQQIADSRAAIRQKHLQLKHGLHDVQEQVSKVFKPIVDPLNEIAKVPLKSTIKTKNEPLNSDEEEQPEEKIFHSTPWKMSNSKKKLFHSLGFNNSEVKNPREEFPKLEQDDFDGDDFQTIEETMPPEKSQTSDDNVETTVNWSKINSVEDFLTLLVKGDPGLDRTFGVIRRSDGTYKISSELVDFMDGKIYVKGKPYSEIPRLLQLLFRKTPNETLITDSDIKNFQNIARETNLLKKDFQSNRSWRLVNFNTKYRNYLKEINPAHPKISNLKGRGLPSFMTATANESPLDYKYWDDPNELVDRLRLLIAERSAGNNNHGNEILAIIEELREAKVIF